MEHGISHMFSWIMTGFFAVMIAVLTGLFLHNNMVNGYQQQVVQVIQRSGGLTSAAKKETEDISKKHYGNYFSVNSDQKNVTLGGTIIYTINGKIPFNVPFGGNSKKQLQTFAKTGRTQSLIRKDSQDYN